MMLKRMDNSQSQLARETLANPRNYRKAMDIEALLIWVYQDQAADAVEGRLDDGMGPAMPRSNLIAIENNGRLGTRIDCAGSGARAAGRIHPDAAAVHEEVQALSPLRMGLVIEYGKSGLRPDCFVGEFPKPVARLRSNGKPMMEYQDREFRIPAYCLLRYDPEPDHIEMMRTVYAEWHAALVDLARRLGHLESHEATGPGIPAELWREESI